MAGECDRIWWRNLRERDRVIDLGGDGGDNIKKDVQEKGWE